MVAGEFNNFILVWTTIVASLCYCYIIGKIFTKSTISRFLCFLPVNLLFVVLPFNLSSVFLGGTTSFLVAWLTNFKLILFASNKGPLFSDPPIPLSQFIVVACFPIKVRESVDAKTSLFSQEYFICTIITRGLLLAIVFCLLYYSEYIHPLIVLPLHSMRMALSAEIFLTLFAALARGLLLPRGVELEPPFDNFYMSTSVQDFWGRRWNRATSDILRLAVYNPVWLVSAPFVTRKWASIPAVLATFVVSGLMHELAYFNCTGVRPSAHMMWFFLLNGMAVSAEIVLRKKSGGKFNVPTIVSWPLTMAFVCCTFSWLFLTPVFAAMADLRTCTEAMSFLEFVFHRRLVPPTELHCPFL